MFNGSSIVALAGNKVFDDLGINNKSEFQKSVLGYATNGEFPVCNTLEDLTKFVEAIKNYKKEDMKTIIGYRAPYNIIEWGLHEGEVIKYSGVSYSSSAYNCIPRTILKTWKPVYEEEFKIGDWVYIKCNNEDYAGRTVKIIEPNASYMPPKDDLVTVDINHNSGGGYNIPIEEIRKATQEEIVAAQTQTVDMGEFKLVVRKGKCFHNEEDISDFVRELNNFYTSTRLFGKHNYAVNIDNVTFSCTGCERSTTTAKQWREVYRLMNIKQ